MSNWPNPTPTVCPSASHGRRSLVLPRVIHLLFVGDELTGWTADGDWAERWAKQGEGRSIEIIDEIKP